MNKLQIGIMFLCAVCLSSCSSLSKQDNILTTQKYKWYSDRIVQGNYTGKALSGTALESNYQSPVNLYKPALIHFKFAINGKDNEMPSGQDHSFICKAINGKSETPVIKFGELLKANKQEAEGVILQQNTELTIRLDMREMLKAFNNQGYYVTRTGQKIYKEDFKGVYIAGDADPLIWDFDNLVNHPILQLTDEDGDGIYETRLTLNDTSKQRGSIFRWSLKNDISACPQLKAPTKLENAIYNLALDEMQNAIEKDSTLRTGKEWPGVWTRDVSYSIILSMAYMQPKVSMNSLMRKVNSRGRIIQDTGTGGAWPCSSDRMVWAIAAYEIYKVTGDQQWLKTIYPIIKNSLEDDFETVYNPRNGLMMGESSFIDWREQSYPRWMQPADIYQSECIGTNAVHYQALNVFSHIAKLLGQAEVSGQYEQKALTLKEAINKNLWMADKGYYAQYLYGRNNYIKSPKSESLGEALAVLFDVTSPEQAKQVTENNPIVPFGAPIFYPHIADMPPYHNNAVWPFVSSYWMHASAKGGNEAGVMQAIGSIYRAAALFCTNKENFVAESGDFLGTQINSSNMLWSLSGNLSITHRLLFGLRFGDNQLSFSPFVAKALKGKRQLTGFPYRKAILDISLEGYGNKIKSFLIDGKESEPVINANLTGHHSVKIVMADNEFHPMKINLVENASSPLMPVVQLNEGKLQWQPIESAVKYEVYKDGKLWKETSDCSILLGDEKGEFQVAAIQKGGFTSFASEPIQIFPSQIYEVEQFAPKSSANYQGYKGDGFVEINKKENTNIEIDITISTEGIYTFDWRYANGNGPTNTENECAIRTLFIDGQKAGVSIFPQRGKHEWSNWGWSNPLQVHLSAGKHKISLTYMPYNENMNLVINQAMLDELRVTKLN